MTLDTRILVTDPIDPGEVFRECQSILDLVNESNRTESQVSEDKESWSGNGSRTMMNLPGQFLPAWMMVYYRPDGPLRAEDSGHEEDCDEDCEFSHELACYLEISFDTSYGYKNKKLGWNCSQLHAEIIKLLGMWLDERRVKWRWRNEYTGEVFDRFEGIETLLGEGVKALDWFQNIVKPAIFASVGPPRRAPGCDFPGDNPPIYSDGRGGYICRCLVCGRCGKHTGNNTQGHFWGYCDVRKTFTEHHMCCPGDCELDEK